MPFKSYLDAKNSFSNRRDAEYGELGETEVNSARPQRLCG